MGILKAASEVRKYDLEAEKFAGHRLDEDSEVCVRFFDSYVDARRQGLTKPKAAKLAEKESGHKKLKNLS